MPPLLPSLLSPTRHRFQCLLTRRKHTLPTSKSEFEPYTPSDAAQSYMLKAKYAASKVASSDDDPKSQYYAANAAYNNSTARAARTGIAPPPRSQIFTKSAETEPSVARAEEQDEDVGGGLEDNPPPAESAPKKNGNARWLSEIKKRIGKCIIFGMDTAQTRKAAEILKILGEEWTELVAGREGFLTGRKRAGLRRQKVVWGEMDCMNHVNNVTYTRYAESARINWAYNYAVHIDPTNKAKWSELWTPNGDGLILRSITTDYKFPMTWPDHISVFHKLRALPSPTDSSFILDVMIMSELHQRPSARCVEDIVVYDYKAGKKVGVRRFMMRAFERTWMEQEKERERVEKRCGMLEGVVRELERGTWDRVDAKEDFGGGT